MQVTQQTSIIRRISCRCERRADTTRAVPMSRANRQGPARSESVLRVAALSEPNVLSPCSAKADDHWLIACSLAPAHSISTTNSQKTGRQSSCRMVIGAVPSASSSRLRGTSEKYTALSSGSAAQANDIYRQFSMPNKAK